MCRHIWCYILVAIVGISAFGLAANSLAQSSPSENDVPWERLWNKAFASEYNGKDIQVTAQWIGIAQSFMSMAAGKSPWDKMVEIGITSIGSTKGTLGQYENQHWDVFIPKDKSDAAFALAEGAKVRIFARAGTLNTPGLGEQIVLIITKIEPIAREGAPPSNTATTPPVTSLSLSASNADIPWAKLWNKAFASDYDGKNIQVLAQWIGIAQSFMSMAAGKSPWDKMVEIGITSVGSTKGTLGQYENQHWDVFIPKDKSDAAFALAEGTKVRIFARAGTLNTPGIGEQIVLIITKIEKLD